ncbi:MAG: adenosylcobinamide-GDP ribazoletransferase [Kutzneria sp.]|nr:adenosylcobinamide-GDP ribazoletransferase [Kutzneria sp.]
MDGLRLAVSWLTVFPVRGPRVDGKTGAQAITLAPLVGALVGATAAALLVGFGSVGMAPLLDGLLVVTVSALLTRGMHLDGLADTVDGLGCYGPPERALAVMRAGGAGPFAAVALVLTIGLQAASLAELDRSGRWGAVVLAAVTGRVAFAWCCRRGVPSARPDGLGALVAGTQPVWVPAVWTAVVLVAAVPVTPGRLWLGPVGVILATALVVALVHHTRRRFGGITGDVLGAACELSTTVVLVTCSLGT